MPAIVAAFAVLIVAFSTWFLAAPATLPDFARHFATPRGVWLACGLRLALAVALWLAAPAVTTPGAFRVLAVLVAAAALALPVLGPARLAALIDWGAARPPALLRALLLAGLAFGAFLGWAVWPALAR